jgi:hypothetical protein
VLSMAMGRGDLSTCHMPGCEIQGYIKYSPAGRGVGEQVGREGVLCFGSQGDTHRCLVGVQCE